MRGTITGVVCIGFMLSLLACTANKESGEDTVSAIFDLHRKGAYKKLVDRYSGYDWKKFESSIVPAIMVYSEAVVVTNSKKESGLSGFLKIFQDAYVQLLRGDAGGADYLFINLSEKSSGLAKFLGYIGRLEVSVATGTTLLMKQPLDALFKMRNSYKDMGMSWAREHYGLYYHYNMGNFKSVAALLEEMEEERSDDYYIYSTRLLLRNNHFHKAIGLLDEALDKVNHTENLLMEKAKLVRLQRGRGAYERYLDRAVDRYPSYHNIRLWKSLALLTSDVEDERHDGIRLAKEILKKYYYNINMRLVISNTLVDMGMLKEAIGIMGGANKIPYNYLYYDLLLAKLDLIQLNISNLKNTIVKMKNVAPYNIDVLWLVYDAKILDLIEGSPYEELELILSLEPYNTDALFELVRLRFKERKWREVLELCEKIINSGRYLTSERREVLENFMVQASKQI